jgi:hypothetical protein
VDEVDEVDEMNEMKRGQVEQAAGRVERKQWDKEIAQKVDNGGRLSSECTIVGRSEGCKVLWYAGLRGLCGLARKKSMRPSWAKSTFPLRRGPFLPCPEYGSFSSCRDKLFSASSGARPSDVIRVALPTLPFVQYQPIFVPTKTTCALSRRIPVICTSDSVVIPPVIATPTAASAFLGRIVRFGQGS